MCVNFQSNFKFQTSLWWRNTHTQCHTLTHNQCLPRPTEGWNSLLFCPVQCSVMFRPPDWFRVSDLWPLTLPPPKEWRPCRRQKSGVGSLTWNVTIHQVVFLLLMLLYWLSVANFVFKLLFFWSCDCGSLLMSQTKECFWPSWASVLNSHLLIVPHSTDCHSQDHWSLISSLIDYLSHLSAVFTGCDQLLISTLLYLSCDQCVQCSVDQTRLIRIYQLFKVYWLYLYCCIMGYLCSHSAWWDVSNYHSLQTNMIKTLLIHKCVHADWVTWYLSADKPSNENMILNTEKHLG